MLAAIIILVIILVLVGFVVSGFNKLRKADVSAQEALGGIDVQLTRRADLIPNLVETVKGYAAHEKSVFDEVTRARAGLAAAAKSDDVQAKAAADAAMEQALVRVNAVAEAYPDLKANQNYQELMRQLADTENQISFARQYYNDATATLNTLVSTIPWMFFTGIASVHKREFYEAPAGQEIPPRVDFGQGGGTGAPAVEPTTPAAPPVQSSATTELPPAGPAGPAEPPAQQPPTQ